MKHVELVYLLYKAHLLWDLQCKAAKKGEEFKPSNHFDPITPEPLEAQAHIYKLKEKDAPEIALCVRHPENLDMKAAIRQALEAFFDGAKYESELYTFNGYVHAIAYSRTIPPSVFPVSD